MSDIDGRVYGRKLLDDNGKNLSIKMAATITGIPYNTMYGYVKKYEITTVREALELKATLYKNCGGKTQNIQYKTKFGMLTVSEMHLRHEHKDEVTIEMISSRVCYHGGMSERLWGPRLQKRHNHKKKEEEEEEKILPVVAGPERIDSDFNRNTFCKTTDIIEGLLICKHYSECSEVRAATGRHSKRWVGSGECFDGEPFLGSGFNSSGRGARAFNKNGTVMT